MKDRPKVAKNFCTTREAAEILGISLKTAQVWVESGMLEAWRTDGGHRRITRESVERLLASSPVPFMPSSPAKSLGNEQRYCIVVAEDDEMLRKLYAIRLSRWAMSPEVILVPDGFHALLEIGRRVPDLLISDLQMPEMDGFRMIRTLKNMDGLSSMKIVVVSGLDKEVIAAGGLPDDVVVLGKPVPFDLLEKVAADSAEVALRS